MLKYSLYDCPCQNSCWKAFLVIQKVLSSIWRSRCWLRSLRDRGGCKHSAAASQLHPPDRCWKDPVSGPIPIDNFLLNSSMKPKQIVSLYQYMMLQEEANSVSFFYCHSVLLFFWTLLWPSSNAICPAQSLPKVDNIINHLSLCTCDLKWLLAKHSYPISSLD